MNKILSISLIILTLTFSAFSQAKSNDAVMKQLKSLHADKTFEIVYDKGANNSKIVGFSNDFGKDEDKRNNVQSFRFGLAFNYAGQAISTVPDVYLLTFQAGTKKDKFRDAHALVFTIDNQVLDLGDARYGNKNEGIEYLNFKLTREQLAKIASGKNVQMKIGSADFTLTAEQIRMFSNLLALSDPTAF